MRTILVVDDDSSFLLETEKMLGEAGYRVLQASDGLRAVRLLDEINGKVDLVIIDLALPGMNGFELIGTLSRRPSGLKIIATSAVFKEMQLESATVLGAHAAIRKPRNAKELPREQWLLTIRQLIGEP